MNKKLLEIESLWHKNVIRPYVMSNREKFLTIPYFMGVTPEFENSKKRIMIVGQEPYDFALYEENINIISEQEWAIEYIRRQVYGIGEVDYNASPFWNAFRKIHEKGIDPCWNNVDNLHRRINDRTYALTLKIERDLQVKVTLERTLLQEQIQITRPDVIWFVTGPSYSESMSRALQINASELKMLTPSKSNCIQEISPLVPDGRKYYWSYHPYYLQIIGKLTSCIDIISEAFAE